MTKLQKRIVESFKRQPLSTVLLGCFFANLFFMMYIIVTKGYPIGITNYVFTAVSLITLIGIRILPDPEVEIYV